MTGVLLYTFAAFAAFAATALLIRSRRKATPREPECQGNYTEGLLEEPCLLLAERVFDPADYIWLRDEIGFPKLADFLARSRQQMALKWLKALRALFKEMVRTPESPVVSSENDPAPGSWHFVWATLRFHLMLSYALLVVRYFGPYHRLIPSLDFVQTLVEPNPEDVDPRVASITRLP